MRVDRGGPDTLALLDRAGNLRLLDFGVATLYNVPVTLTATVNVSSAYYQKGVSVAQRIADKMRRGTLEYEGSAASMSELYFKAVSIQIPDHNGTNHTVFSGFFPSSTEVVGADGSYGSITAFDYSWYLTMQYLSDSQMSLLTDEKQVAQKRYRQYFEEHVEWPIIQVGDVIYGETSGALGVVTDTVHYGYMWFEVDSTNSIPYVSGEHLLKNGEWISTADGDSLDITGTIDPVTPDEYITDLLGGGDYAKTTMCKPHRITALGGAEGFWGDKPQVDFNFEEKTTKRQAIEELSKYLECIFLVKPGASYGLAYWIPEDDIDSGSVGLDLPAKVTITAGTNDYLASGVTCESKGEEKYNRVTVRCKNPLTGEWYKSVEETDEVIGGDPPIEYYEINKDIGSQEECDQRAADLIAYYAVQIKTWTATFYLRSDFELLQQLAFSGFGDQIPNGDYRITAIEYQYNEAACLNQVVVTLVPKEQFKAYLNLHRVFTDTVSEIRAVVQDELNKLGSLETGVATGVDVDGNVTAKNDRGITRTGRDAGS